MSKKELAAELLQKLQAGEITKEEAFEILKARGGGGRASRISAPTLGPEPRALNEELGQKQKGDESPRPDFLARGDEAPQTSTSNGELKGKEGRDAQEEKESSGKDSPQLDDSIYRGELSCGSSNTTTHIQLKQNNISDVQSCVSNLLQLDYSEILRLSQILQEIVLLDSNRTRVILLIAKKFGFVYTRLVCRLFPSYDATNVNRKIHTLEFWGLLERISPYDLQDDALKRFKFIMGYLVRKSNRSLGDIRKQIKLYRINPVYLPLVEKLIKPNPEEGKILANWKQLVRRSHATAQEPGLPPELLAKLRREAMERRWRRVGIL